MATTLHEKAGAALNLAAPAFCNAVFSGKHGLSQKVTINANFAGSVKHINAGRAALDIEADVTVRYIDFIAGYCVAVKTVANAGYADVLVAIGSQANHYIAFAIVMISDKAHA